MTRMLIPVLMLLALTGLVSAQEKPGVPQEAKALVDKIAPFLDEGMFAVLHVNLDKFDPARLSARLTKLAPKTSPEWQESLTRLGDLRAKLRDTNIHHAFVVVSFSADLNQPALLVFPVGKQLSGPVDRPPPGEALLALAEAIPGGVKNAHDCLISGSPTAIRKVMERKNANPVPALLPDLATALSNEGMQPASLALVLSPSMRRILEENLPTLPPQVGGGSSQVLSKGLRWGSLTLVENEEAGYALRLHVEASDAEMAVRLARLASTGVEALLQTPEVQQTPGLKDLVKLLELKPQGKSIGLALEDKSLVTAVLPALARVQGAAGAARDVNSLKQIGLAMHNHLDQHKGKFPSQAITDNQGQPLLSWRVRLLPYLGQKQLYDKFKLDEPWDSDHNKKLIKEMPAVFRTSQAPKLADEGKTTFVVPVNPDTIFPPGKAVGIIDIPDGTSNTILALEIDPARAVPWTKPEDLNVDLKKPLDGLGFDQDGKVHLLFADGSVRRITKMIDPKTLAALFTRAGGEVTGDY
jgi:hypothetical protein